MAIRLFPDIIFTAEVCCALKYGNNIVSISQCLKHQRDYTNFGIPNCFIGFEGKEWSQKDYEAYIKTLPVNLEGLSTMKLLTQGVYSNKTLKALGITDRIINNLQVDIGYSYRKLGTDNWENDAYEIIYNRD